MEVPVVFLRNQSQAIPSEITPEFLDVLRAHGVVQANVFGSTTRGEERPDSDLDLLVTFDPPVSLFQQMDVADALSGLCGRRVDLLTHIDPIFAPYIEPTLVPLPL
jgi:predicted nucleotidyltransferase